MLCPLLYGLRAWLGTYPTLCRATLAAGVFVAISLVPIQAADATKKSFNIRAGEAPHTLKQFAEQAGGDRLLYSVDAVKGVQTRPLEGKFTPREALERMLRGSGLTVTEDAQTGALTIYRRDALLNAKSSGPGAATPSRSREQSDPDLKKKAPRAS